MEQNSPHAYSHTRAFVPLSRQIIREDSKLNPGYMQRMEIITHYTYKIEDQERESKNWLPDMVRATGMRPKKRNTVTGEDERKFYSSTRTLDATVSWIPECTSGIWSNRAIGYSTTLKSNSCIIFVHSFQRRVTDTRKVKIFMKHGNRLITRHLTI